MLAHAFLGNDKVSHVFKFNPSTVEWAYQHNIKSQDTLGGRVVQLLSVQVTGMSFQGVTATRAELQRLGTNVAKIMNWQIHRQASVTLRVPSRNWNFKVYVEAMPQIGWDYATVSYPFQLSLKVEEDIAGVKSQQIFRQELLRLKDKIDYRDDIHGGDTSQFKKIVDSLSMAPLLGSTGANGGGTSEGAGGSAPTPVSKCTGPGTGGYRMTYDQAAKFAIGAGFRGDNAAKIVAVGKAESGLYTCAFNHNNNGTNDYGWLQINTVNFSGLNKGPECAFDPACCAWIGYKISGGTRFTPWCTYCAKVGTTQTCGTNCSNPGGSNAPYYQYLNDARQAVYRQGGYGVR